MGMGMKSLNREGIGTKNLFTHTSNLHTVATVPWEIYERSNSDFSNKS